LSFGGAEAGVKECAIEGDSICGEPATAKLRSGTAARCRAPSTPPPADTPAEERRFALVSLFQVSRIHTFKRVSRIAAMR